MTATDAKRFPRLRFAIRHPLRTLRRNQNKAIDRVHFGLGQIIGVVVFVAWALWWLGRAYYDAFSP
ncbi:hypothetical protein ACF1DY_31875 [Streptomyces albus]|uniref:hypothetical protein n=1 Tax=Streptomyces albus TaxID=1888 RepID=UPI0036FF69D0